MHLPGNHDDKLYRYLRSKKAQITHGLEASLAQIETLSEEQRTAWVQGYMTFYEGLVSHYVMDRGNLVVAHAGMKERYQGRASRRVHEFALYGETTGEFGLPERLHWAADYRGHAAVVYGHTPVYEATWLNNTINVDTGCVFGGRLTALRWPERKLVSVPARASTVYPPSDASTKGASLSLSSRSSCALRLQYLHFTAHLTRPGRFFSRCAALDSPNCMAAVRSKTTSCVGGDARGRSNGI